MALRKQSLTKAACQPHTHTHTHKPRHKAMNRSSERTSKGIQASSKHQSLRIVSTWLLRSGVLTSACPAQK